MIYFTRNQGTDNEHSSATATGLVVEHLPPGVGHIAGGVHALNAAVHAPGQAAFAKEIQIPPDGLGSDPKMPGEILHPNEVRLVKPFGDVRLTF